MSSTPEFSQKAAAETGEKTPPVFNIWQAHLANRLGISEEELRLRRDKFLQRDLHFQKRGARMLYSAEGEEALRATLFVGVSAQNTASDTSPEKNGDGTAEKQPAVAGLLSWPHAPKPTELKVWRTAPHIKNAHVLEAYDPKTDPKIRANIVTVRVSSNANFVPEMLIPVRHVSGNLYELTRRAPRQRGRW